MSRHSRPAWAGKSRDENEPNIVKALEAVGCTVERLDTPADLLVGRGARNILIEVKRPGANRNTKHAQKQREAREAWKGQIAVVSSPEEAIAVVQAVTRPNAYPTK